jgi:hypothetical protein
MVRVVMKIFKFITVLLIMFTVVAKEYYFVFGVKKYKIILESNEKKIEEKVFKHIYDILNIGDGVEVVE